MDIKFKPTANPHLFWMSFRCDLKLGGFISWNEKGKDQDEMSFMAVVSGNCVLSRRNSEMKRSEEKKHLKEKKKRRRRHQQPCQKCHDLPKNDDLKMYLSSPH